MTHSVTAAVAVLSCLFACTPTQLACPCPYSQASLSLSSEDSHSFSHLSPPHSIPLSHTSQDKIDESEDKEAILGADILNPTTGLSLKDYLEGREGAHNELIIRGLLGKQGMKDDSTTYLDSEVSCCCLCLRGGLLCRVCCG